LFHIPLISPSFIFFHFIALKMFRNDWILWRSSLCNVLQPRDASSSWVQMFSPEICSQAFPVDIPSSDSGIRFYTLHLTVLTETDGE
jgi:hypothetical protein